MPQPFDSFHVAAPAECDAARASLLSTIFGANGPPTDVPFLSVRGWGPDVAIVHQGHLNDAESAGMGRLCEDLVQAGHTVVTALMPGSASTANHNTGVYPLSSFLSPTIRAANWAAANRTGEIRMLGLSGGGWTTLLASALDTRIRKSIACAGWAPQYLWPTPTAGDWEQRLDQRIPPYTYLDLAVLACQGGRKHLQLLHSHDVCCFNQAWLSSGPDYLNELQARAVAVGGEFSRRIQPATLHEWSQSDRRDAVDWLTSGAAPTRTVVDDSVRTGTWTYWTTTNPQGYQGGYWTAVKDSGGTCTWTRASDKKTKVCATWVNHSNRASNAPYRIKVDGVQVAELRINQRVAPRADQSAGGATGGTYNFQVLCEVQPTSSVEVTLGCDGCDGYLAADAMMFESPG